MILKKLFGAFLILEDMSMALTTYDSQLSNNVQVFLERDFDFFRQHVRIEDFATTKGRNIFLVMAQMRQRKGQINLFDQFFKPLKTEMEGYEQQFYRDLLKAFLTQESNYKYLHSLYLRYVLGVMIESPYLSEIFNSFLKNNPDHDLDIIKIKAFKNTVFEMACLMNYLEQFAQVDDYQKLANVLTSFKKAFGQYCLKGLSNQAFRDEIHKIQKMPDYQEIVDNRMGYYNQVANIVLAMFTLGLSLLFQYYQTGGKNRYYLFYKTETAFLLDQVMQNQVLAIKQ